MKSQKLYLAVFIILINCQILFSQEKDGNLILLYSSQKIGAEELRVHIDNLTLGINESPNSIGYIVIYGGLDKIENAFNKQNVIRSLRSRGYNSKDKLLPLSTTDIENPRFEFWISKNGEPPIIKKELDPFNLPGTGKAISFVEDVIAKGEIDGKQDYYIAASCEAGCHPTLDFPLLSNFLDENPGINAYVIIHAKNIKIAKEVKNFLTRKSLEDSSISSNQLNFLFGDKNKIESNQYSEIQVFLAPNVSQLPKSSKKYRPL